MGILKILIGVIRLTILPSGFGSCVAEPGKQDKL